MNIVIFLHSRGRTIKKIFVPFVSDLVMHVKLFCWKYVEIREFVAHKRPNVISHHYITLHEGIYHK
jgi:hypothetical protein